MPSEMQASTRYSGLEKLRFAASQGGHWPVLRASVSGVQTWNEMMYFRINYRWVDETSHHVRNDLQAKLMESRIIGFLDDNADGTLQVAELRGPYASLKGRFAELDLNHDGGLDLKELAAANLTRSAARRLAETDIEQ